MPVRGQFLAEPRHRGFLLLELLREHLLRLTKLVFQTPHEILKRSRLDGGRMDQFAAPHFMRHGLLFEFLFQELDLTRFFRECFLRGGHHPFLLGLKAFVGAIVGGMTSYPGAALGAFGVGILESFASFQSSTLKDVIVFSLLIPILLWRSFASQHSEEEVEE